MLSNRTLRIVIVLATLSIVGITLTQIYWVRQAFDLHQDEFERDIKVALYAVAKSLYKNNNAQFPKENPVEQVSRNYFVVTLGKGLIINAIEERVQTELSSKNIDADFEYGIYDCHTDQMVYCNYVNREKPLEVSKSSILPKLPDQEYYFGVYFPSRISQVVNRMGVWIFSSLALLFVILFFAFSMFVILRQRRLSEVQRDFINNLTHEFKTPISTINISASVLQQPTVVNTPERLLNYATIIQKESDRLQSQVDKVLEAAKVNYSSKHLKREPIDIHELINKVVETFVVKHKEIKINTYLNANNILILLDKVHIINVLYNLIDNAIKFCDTIPKIEIVTKNVKDKLNIIVSDNGIGIPEEDIKKIFGKFYRISTGDRHDVKGFGLGLYYAKYIVEGHQGNIEVSSTESGTVFKIELPVK